MNVTNQLYPSSEQAKDFFIAPESGPFVMVNLLKFRPKAEYPNGSDSNLSGFQAYQRYASEVVDQIKAVGGTTGYAGPVTGLMLGEVDELWDMVALVEYPSLAAMVAMFENPAYQKIAKHRSAGLAGQLNLKVRGPMVAQ